MGLVRRGVDGREPRSLHGGGSWRLLAADLGQVPAMDVRLLSDRSALAAQSRLSHWWNSDNPNADPLARGQIVERAVSADRLPAHHNHSAERRQCEFSR